MEKLLKAFEGVKKAGEVFVEKFTEIENLLKEKEAADAGEKKIMLRDLEAGSSFYADGEKFIVLDQFSGFDNGFELQGTFVMKDELFGESMEFSDCTTDYNKSKVKELCDTEILADFEKKFGKENILKHTLEKVLSVDGQTLYEDINCKVRIMCFEEARKYNELIVNKSLENWYWTLTPWSSEERGWEYSMSVVSPSGRIGVNNYYNSNGVRPVCILKSNIFVSKEV